MEKKERITVYLPRKLYIEIFDRNLDHQFSYLVALLVEEFIRTTDARISWAEMPNKTEQREYLERLVRGLLGRAGATYMQEGQTELSAEFPKPSVQESPKQTELPSEPPKPSVQGSPKEAHEVSEPEPVKQKVSPKEDDFDDDILKKLESFW
jgi:hypothetical protein